MDLSPHVALFMFYVSSSLSGNEVLFSLETASDYVKDEKACFYGFKCAAVGYEFNPGPDEVHTCLHISLAFFLPAQILFLSEVLVMNNRECCNILLTNRLFRASSCLRKSWPTWAVCVRRL